MERLNALLKQEADVYNCDDYLSPRFQQNLVLKSDATFPSASSSSTSTINEVWREKICEWSYQVVDHFDFSREVVAISISFLDRFLCTTFVDKKLFQLAAMTTLYLSIKLYEPGKLSMSSMIDLSRGFFKVEQMAFMETSILRALKWRVHPPTPFTFSRHFLHLVPNSSSLPAPLRNDILELARFLTELCVIDYFFVPHDASTIGIAALRNAMEFVRYPADDFLEQLKLLNIDSESKEVSECRSRLKQLYLQGGYSRPDEVRSESGSPVCVSGFNAASVSNKW